MYPETKFKPERRTTSGYSNPNNIYNNLDQYLNNRTSGPSNGHDISHNIGAQDYKNRTYEYHEKYGGNTSGESSNLYNKTSSYGIPTKKSYAPQRRSIYTTPITKTYTSQLTSPKSYSSGIPSPIEGQKQKASLSAYNLIPKSLLNEDNKKPTMPTKEPKSSAQNATANKRNSLQYPANKTTHSKRNSINFDNRRRSQSHPTKTKTENTVQKPKLGVIGVLSAKKSLNEFSKRSSRVLNQQTEEINNLKARIQELTSDQEILRKLNDVSTEDTLLDFNDKYLAPLLNKMSTYLMKFTSEYNEMIKSNSDFIDSQHDRTECLVELAANLNSQLHNFIEDFECDRFDERTYNEKRNQVDVIADTTSRLNSQLARVVLQLDDFRDSPDFQKENMTNSIQSLGVILQQLNKAAITVNQKIAEYENTIRQKDELFIRDQNSKEIEIDALQHKIKELTAALEQKPMVRELKTQNRELMMANEKPTTVVKEIVSNEALEKYKNDLVKLNHNLSNVTLLFDNEIQQKSGLMKTQEQKINDLTDRTAKLNTQLANITLLFDSEINLKDRIIRDKESQIERLRKNAAELNHNLSVLSLLSNEKEVSNKRNVNDLMDTISDLRTKWAAINSNLLTLTSTVNDQLKSKNEEIRLNRKDAVYFRDFTHQIHNQMMDYVGDYLQRIWNKNHENEILIEKNRNLMNYCSDLNGRIARFTLEINDLQNEKNMLMNRLANDTPMATRDIPVQQQQHQDLECRGDTGLWWLFYKPQAEEMSQEIQQQSRDIEVDTVPQTREVETVFVPQPIDDARIEYYRNMAVDLNNRVALLTLDIDSLKVNMFNDRAVEETEVNGNEEETERDNTFNLFKNQAIALNSNLAKLTLEHNDFKNQELKKNENLIRNSEEKIDYYQQMAANLNTRLSLLSLEMNDVMSGVNNTRDVNTDEQTQYYQNLVENLNTKINDLLKENEDLKAQQSEIQQTRSIPQNDEPVEIVEVVEVIEDEDQVKRFRDLAVDLNSRLAKLSLEFNETPKSRTEIVDNETPKSITENVDNEYIKKIQDQVIDLNQRLSVLTLNSNDEINNLKKQLVQNDQDNFRDKVVDLNQRLAILTLSSNDEVNELKKQIAQMQNIPYEENVRDIEQTREVVVDDTNNDSIVCVDNVNSRNFQNEAVDLNQRLAVLTLSANDEVNNLKKQVSEKDLLIDQLRNKLALMNRQIIDLTFNSNAESQRNDVPTEQYEVPMERSVSAVDIPKSDNIIEPLIRLPLAVDYLFEQPKAVETPVVEAPVKAPVEAPVVPKSDNIIEPLIRLPLAVDYLFEQPKAVEAPVVEAPVVPKSDNIIEPLIRLPLAVDYLFEQPKAVEAPVVEVPVEAPVEAPVVPKSDNIIEPLIRLPLAVDYLFEQPKAVETAVVETPVVETPVVEIPVIEDPIVEQVPREAPVVEQVPREAQSEIPSTNELELMEELNKEKVKNQELNQIIENMRKEMQSISEYLKETKSCAASLQNVNQAPVSISAEELLSIAEYLKETKRSLEEYKNNNTSELQRTAPVIASNEELSSLAEYLKETKRSLEEFKNSNANEMNSLASYLKDTLTMAKECRDSYAKY